MNPDTNGASFHFVLHSNGKGAAANRSPKTFCVPRLGATPAAARSAFDLGHVNDCHVLTIGARFQIVEDLARLFSVIKIPNHFFDLRCKAAAFDIILRNDAVEKLAEFYETLPQSTSSLPQ